MSTHTDPAVKATHDAYNEAQGDLIRALRHAADIIQDRLVAFDDDGHMRHLDHANGIVDKVLRDLPYFGLSRLITAADRADEAIRQARETSR